MSSGQGTEPGLLYTQAIDLYNKGKFQDALQKYLSISQDVWSSPDLLYNIGNSYAELDSIGLAVLYYERALRMDASHTDARNNLALVKDKIEVDITEIPDFFLLVWWRSLASCLVSFIWFALGIITLVLLAWLYRLFLRGELSQARWITLASIAISISVLCHALGYTQYDQETSKEYAIVTAASLVLKFAPDDRSEDLITLADGIKLRVLDQINEWVKVELADKEVGWLLQDDITRI